MIIQFEPDLSHCIQTLAKHEYDRIKKGFLGSGARDPQNEQRLELLRQFLEGTDFNKLRSEYESFLIQGKRIRFTVGPVADETGYHFEVL